MLGIGFLATLTPSSATLRECFYRNSGSGITFVLSKRFSAYSLDKTVPMISKIVDFPAPGMAATASTFLDVGELKEVVPGYLQDR